MNQFAPFSTKKIKYILVSFALCLLPLLGAAQTTPDTIINNRPITIDADNQQIDMQKNTITFTGNVVVVQEGLKVKANTVIITNMQSRDNQTITAYGSPIYFEKFIENDTKHMITGHSDQLIYSVKQNTVTLIGNAELFQQDNRINSDKITYDIEKQKINAQPEKGNRVTTTIIPNQVKEIKQ